MTNKELEKEIEKLKIEVEMLKGMVNRPCYMPPPSIPYQPEPHKWPDYIVYCGGNNA